MFSAVEKLSPILIGREQGKLDRLTLELSLPATHAAKGWGSCWIPGSYTPCTGR